MISKAAAVLLLSAPMWAQANVVKYHATINDVKYVYATVPAVGHLKPGDVLETNTLDAFGNVLQKPGDTLSMVKGDNPLTGPFYVDGAEPGDTVAVKILDLQVDSDQGVGALGPGFGAINATSLYPHAGVVCAGERSGSIPLTMPPTWGRFRHWIRSFQ